MSQGVPNVNQGDSEATLFVPAFGLRNSHLQTVLSSQGPRKYNREKRFSPYLKSQFAILLNGGDGVRLEGFHNRASEEPSNELVIMIHGWEGSHESTYMKSMATSLLDEGYDTFRLNMRDHGETHHLNKGLFNSTLLDEVMNAISDLQSRLRYQKYTLVGFSLGGNFCLRVAANAHDKPLVLERVIAFCPAVHGGQSTQALNQPQNWFYSHYFVRKWRRSLLKKLEHWPEYDFGADLGSLKTLNEMNEAFVPRYTHFEKVDDYFDAYAIDGDKLANTICPCYLHFSKDDMIIPVKGVNLLCDNPDLHVTITEYGGHCGFLMNWRGDSWQDVRTLELISR